MKNLVLILLYLCFLAIIQISMAIDSEEKNDNKSIEHDSATPPPPGQGGRSFSLFGALFRKIRNRWHGQNEPVPLYAGPAFPLAGYYNCPVYGCNPALNYRPAPYEATNYYNRPLYSDIAVAPPAGYALNPQQQQQQQQQSNVVIYQNGQRQAQQSPGFVAPNYAPPQTGFSNTYGGSQFYPPPTTLTAPAPLPAPATLPYPPRQHNGNYAAPNNIVGIGVIASPQFPLNNYNGYNASHLPPQQPPTQNYQPTYAP